MHTTGGLVFRAAKLPVYYELIPGNRQRQSVPVVPKPTYSPGIGKRGEVASTDQRRTAPRWFTRRTAAIRTSRPSARSIQVCKTRVWYSSVVMEHGLYVIHVNYDWR